MKSEERKKRIREETRERVRRLREKRREEFRQAGNDTVQSTGSTSDITPAFKSRMAKSRALKKTVQALPKTPEKKAELLESISSSPRTRKILTRKGLVKTPEELKETER